MENKFEVVKECTPNQVGCPTTSYQDVNVCIPVTIKGQILFREGHTWQGRLIWQDEGQEAVFQSGIELIQLLDEIMAE